MSLQSNFMKQLAKPGERSRLTPIWGFTQHHRPKCLSFNNFMKLLAKPRKKKLLSLKGHLRDFKGLNVSRLGILWSNMPNLGKEAIFSSSEQLHKIIGLNASPSAILWSKLWNQRKEAFFLSWRILTRRLLSIIILHSLFSLPTLPLDSIFILNRMLWPLAQYHKIRVKLVTSIYTTVMA